MIGPSTATTYKTRPLGDLVEFLDHLRKPITAKDRRPGPIPYYGANGQQDSVEGFLFDEPLVLLAEDGGHFDDPDRGVAYRVDGRSWVNNHAHVLRAGSSIDTGYLTRVLENFDVTKFLTGSTRAKLTKAGASRIPIPLPGIEEQRRIAAVLDAADDLRTRRHQALAKLDTLTQAIFIDMFGDPSRDSASHRPIGSFAAVVTGNTPPRSKSENYGTEIEWVKSGDIDEAGAVGVAAEGLSAAGRQVGRVAPAGSCLVVCIAGSPRSIGRAGLLDRSVAFNQQINAIVPSEDVNPEFLLHQLRVGQRVVQKASTNAMKGMVSKSKLESVRLLVPPLGEQHAFTAIAARIRHCSERNSVASAEVDTLFASLQQRAFAGEL